MIPYKPGWNDESQRPMFTIHPLAPRQISKEKTQIIHSLNNKYRKFSKNLLI